MTVADRKYLGWTVALFALLGLVGAGALLYKPLRTRYAIYKVQHTTEDDVVKGRVANERYCQWANECLAAAKAGNRLAIEAVIDASNFGDESFSYTTGTVAFEAAAAQPSAFFAALNKRSPERIAEVLLDIQVCINGDFDAELRPGDYRNDQTPRGVVRELGRHLNAKDPEVRRVATAALAFTRRRFAKELAEAEKGQK